MYETQVTVVGNLLTDVDNHRLNDGTVVANFRVASKERRFDRSGGTWVDGDRLYIDVRCWRGLAQNAFESLKKGDPVVVTGRIFTRNYEHQGQSRTSTTLEARSVAADLAHCTVVLTCSPVPAAAPPTSIPVTTTGRSMPARSTTAATVGRSATATHSEPA